MDGFSAFSMVNSGENRDCREGLSFWADFQSFAWLFWAETRLGIEVGPVIPPLTAVSRITRS